MAQNKPNSMALCAAAPLATFGYYCLFKGSWTQGKVYGHTTSERCLLVIQQWPWNFHNEIYA